MKAKGKIIKNHKVLENPSPRKLKVPIITENKKNKMRQNTSKKPHKHIKMNIDNPSVKEI